MIFQDRREAGELLAKELLKKKLVGSKFLVASIPRGGVVVGNEIASKLKLAHTVLVVKKLGAPYNSELAIGATASFGRPVLDRWLIRDLSVSRDYLKKETATKKKEARSREKLLGISLNGAKFKGKSVIVADDGIATGQTMKMAAKILRQFGTSRIILAVGCMPSANVEEVKKDFDEVICPCVSSDFMAVGQFYRDFRKVEDAEVKDILDESSND